MSDQRPDDTDIIRDRARRLFTFLRELSQMRTKTVRSLDAYEEVLWLHDIPADRHCQRIFRDDLVGPWIEVRKPDLPPPPEPPEEIRDWLAREAVHDSSLEEPPLRETIRQLVGEGDERYARDLHLKDHPGVRQVWREWVDERWRSWAQHTSPHRGAAIDAMPGRAFVVSARSPVASPFGGPAWGLADMSVRCRVEMLGGLRVLRGDREIARFATQRTAALLAYVAYHLHQAHPREVLVETFWSGGVPPSGRNSLNTALSSLRHQLEPPGIPRGALIRSSRHTVQLNPGAVTTDVADLRSVSQ